MSTALSMEKIDETPTNMNRNTKSRLLIAFGSNAYPKRKMWSVECVERRADLILVP
jgi:hypothetical protein